VFAHAIPIGMATLRATPVLPDGQIRRADVRITITPFGVIAMELLVETHVLVMTTTQMDTGPEIQHARHVLLDFREAIVYQRLSRLLLALLDITL
jgi:hypothetical protein